MNDDLHPDAIDHELHRRFDVDAPVAADPDAVLDSMRPRLRQARTRRRASFASAIAGVAVVVVVLAFVLGGGNGGGTGSVRVPPASNGTVTTRPATSTTTPTGGSATPDTTPTTTPDSVPATTPDTVAQTVPATTPTGPPPTDYFSDFSSTGGNITVHVARDQVTLSNTAAAPGYTSEVHDDGPTRVEVRFSNGSTEWRIRVDLVDGALVPEITQHG